MTPARRAPARGRVGLGIRAGATAGLLTGLCHALLFGGIDFSRGDPLGSLLRLPPREYALVAVLVAAGALTGALVSRWTPDD